MNPTASETRPVSLGSAKLEQSRSLLAEHRHHRHPLAGFAGFYSDEPGVDCDEFSAALDRHALEPEYLRRRGCTAVLQRLLSRGTANKYLREGKTSEDKKKNEHPDHSTVDAFGAEAELPVSLNGFQPVRFPSDGAISLRLCRTLRRDSGPLRCLGHFLGNQCASLLEFERNNTRSKNTTGRSQVIIRKNRIVLQIILCGDKRSHGQRNTQQQQTT